MGIQNLTSFVRQNYETLTSEFKLQNTSVVIDGAALHRFLFERSREEQRNERYGGNDGVYATVVKKFFGRLKACNVGPVFVVLPGDSNLGSTKDGSLKTKRDRRKEKFSKLVGVGEGNTANVGREPYLASYSSFIVLRQVLEELAPDGVKFVRSPFESLGDLVVVANEVGCPLLSNNSNCYLFDIKGGFVHFETIKYSADAVDAASGDAPEAEDYLESRLYSLDNLLRQYPEIENRKLAIFATIFGNDFRHRNNRDPLYFNLSKRLRALGETKTAHDRMPLVLKWLTTKTNEAAMKEIRTLCPSNQARGIELAIVDTFKYINLELSCKCLLKHLNGEECAEDHSMTLVGGRTFPDKWVRKYIDNRHRKPLLNLMLFGKLSTLLQFDDYSEQKESSFVFAHDLLASLSGLLRCSDTENDGQVIEVDDWHSPEKEESKPELDLIKLPIKLKIGDDRLPTLEELGDKNMVTKRSLILALIGSTDEELESMRTKLTVLSASNVMDDKLMVNLATVVLLMKYSFRDIISKLATDELFKKFGYAQILASLYLVGGNVADELDMKQFEMRPDEEKVRRDIVHCNNQFQALLSVFIMINEVLDYPLPKMNFPKIFNSILVYNLVREDAETPPKIKELLKLN